MLSTVLCATLIVAAICGDGVFIRSDKRNTITHSDGRTEFHDDLNKVFVTADRQVIIYNHGVNALDHVPWREHAAALAARLQETQPTNLTAVLDIAAAALDPAVAAEWRRTRLGDFCAFVVIARLPDGQYHAGEVSWKRNESVQKKPLGRFIRSGSGVKYLQPSASQKRTAHWAGITADQAQAEVAALYAAAVEAQAAAQGQEFSPAYDDLVVKP